MARQLISKFLKAKMYREKVNDVSKWVIYLIYKSKKNIKSILNSFSVYGWFWMSNAHETAET